MTKNKTSILQSLVSLFQKTKIALSMEQLEDGTVIEIDDTTKEVYKLDPDGNRLELLADGEYVLAGGQTIVIKDGKVQDPEAVNPMEPAVEVTIEQEKPVEEKQEIIETDPLYLEIKTMLEEMVSTIKGLEERIGKLEGSVSQSKAELTKMSMQPVKEVVVRKDVPLVESEMTKLTKQAKANLGLK